jgi:hypothetical protein
MIAMKEIRKIQPDVTNASSIHSSGKKRMRRAFCTSALDRLERKRKVRIGQIQSKEVAKDVAVFGGACEHAPLNVAIGMPHIEPGVEQCQPGLARTGARCDQVAR